MKKIFKSIACCCLSIAIAIACCFGAMKMSKNQRFLGTSCNKASAYSFIQNGDIQTFTTDTYLASNFPMFARNTASIALSPVDNSDYYFNYSFYFTKESNKINLYASVAYKTISNNSFNPSLGYNRFGIYSYNYSGGSGSLPPTLQQTYGHVASDVTDYFQTGFYFYVSSPELSLDFSYYTIYFYDNYTLNTPSEFSLTNYIAYSFFDNSGNYLTVFVGYNGYTIENYPFIYLNEGVYYLSPSSRFDNNSYYNEGYNNGYSQGSQEGYIQGSEEGYNNGYSQGSQEGYNNGYTQGLESSERLGFPALITSVIDVPVKVFTSLFNFEILGVNILTFVTSLLTIALILAIVRKVKSD